MSERIKFYTDEHVSTAVVTGLRRRGVDVLTTQEAGMREGRVIFTQDDDFLRLHAVGINHAGIAYVHQRTPVGDIIRGLMLIHQVLTPGDMRNHLEYL